MTLEEEIAIEMNKPQRERKTNAELAAAYGVTPRTIRKKKTDYRRHNREEWDEFFDIPKSIITSRGKTVRLPDGSYEKVTFRPQDEALHHALRFEDVERAVANVKYQPSTGERSGTLVVCAADFQAGKVGSGGNSISLVERVVAVLQRWENELPHYDTIILAELGDIIESFTNVVSQSQTNDLSLTDQIRTAQLLLVECIKVLAPKCRRLIYAAVPSNHSAVRSGIGSKNRSNAPDDDYGLLIQENIALALEGRDAFKHIEYVKPEKWEEATTVLLADGTGVGFTHGDLAGSMSKMDSWFAGCSHGHRGGLHDADILVHGHFHTPALSMSGDCRWIVSAPSIDNGSDWFTNKTGKRSPSAMLTFEAAHGRVENWKLWEA